MKRLIPSTLILLIFLSSCHTTRITKSQYCKICLETADGIILDTESALLSNSQNDYVKEIIQKEFKNMGINNVFDKYELDYEYFKYGIKNIDKLEDMKALNLNLDIKYILKANVSEMRESEGYDQVDPNSSIYPIPRTPMLNSSLLNYALVETSSGEVVYKIHINTSDSEIPINTKDGMEEYYNLGTSFRTLRVGAKRGTKYIVADCSCPKMSTVRWRRLFQKKQKL
ncbi:MULTISPECIES: hypothetical protein [Rhodonellum]|nr:MULTISPECIES: hypothetical protein [Rhodonellum]MDO9554010.1 hypothetical protein [Rhodonellum sp.]